MRHFFVFGVVLLSLTFSAVISAADQKDKIPDDTARQIRQAVEQKSPIILDVSHSVWKYAELGYKEFKSVVKYVEVLRKEGFQVEEKAGGIPTAFIARYGSGTPVIGLLAEYDALPKLGQQSGIAVQTPTTENEDGHGCGHNSLGAGALGAALAVQSYLKNNSIKGTIVLFGCPAEEFGYGKAFMAKAGCFKGVDAVFSWHPSTWNNAVPSTNNAYYRVSFSFKGISTHAAGNPQNGRSAVDACELTNVGANYLREHMASSARIHYAWVNAGGTAPNIVYDEAKLMYFVRAPKLSEANALLQRLIKVAQGAAMMTETTLSYRILGGLNGVLVNTVMSETLSEALKEMGAPEFDEKDKALATKFVALKNPEAAKAGKVLNQSVQLYKKGMSLSHSTASTDDGDVSQLVPIARLQMATCANGTPGHSWMFTAQTATSIGDKGTLAASRTLARACTLLLEHPDRIAAAKKEHFSKSGGKYQSPIPDDVTIEEQ